ncbi:MAG: regulatory protein RecX [Bacteroidota bacterium]
MAESPLFRIALKKVMAKCSRREFCISEIQAKLQSWSVGNDEEEKIIAMLISENFINESRYTIAFVKDKFNYNKWGKVKIAANLRSKNIPADLIGKTLDTIDNDLYNKVLNDLISAHRRIIKAKNPYDLKAKLLRYGLSKGFESSLLYDLLNDIHYKWPESDQKDQT